MIFNFSCRWNIWFSSLFREFISLILLLENLSGRWSIGFSSLFREFISLMHRNSLSRYKNGLRVFVPFQGIHFFNRNYTRLSVKNWTRVFVPFQGIHFFNPDLSTSMFMRLKTSFCGANLIFLFLISFHSTKQVSIPHK